MWINHISGVSAIILGEWECMTAEIPVFKENNVKETALESPSLDNDLLYENLSIRAINICKSTPIFTPRDAIEYI
jgi:hypothetical protein